MKDLGVTDGTLCRNANLTELQEKFKFLKLFDTSKLNV